MVKYYRQILLLIVLLATLVGLFVAEIKIILNTEAQREQIINETIKIVREKEFQFLKNNNNYFADTLTIYSNYNTVSTQALKHNIGLCVFKNDSLVLWNNNQLNIERYYKILQSGTRFLLANNGFYLAYFFKYGTYSLVQYYLIKTNYQYTNQYIQNHFNAELNFLGSAMPSPSPINGFANIADSKGNFLFAIQVYNSPGYTPNWLKLLIFINIIFIIIQFSFVVKKLLQVNIYLASCVFFILTLLAKFILLKFNLPVFLYKHELFSSSSIYASSTFVPSLGDFILLILIVLWFFLLLGNKSYAKNKSFKSNVFTLFVAALLCITVIDSACDAVKSLVFDSQISFDLNNLYSLNYTSFIALISVVLIVVVVYLMCKRFYIILLNTNISNFKKIIYTFMVFYFVHPYIVVYLFERNAYYPLINTLIVFVFLGYTFFVIKRINRLQQFLILAILFSAFASFAVYYWSNKRELEKRELFAEKLMLQNDINTEDFLRIIEDKILLDKEVISYFNNPIALQTQLQRRLKQLYFTGYLSKYEVTIYDYDGDKNYYRERSPYFFNQINYAYNELSNLTISKRFRLLNTQSYIKGYLGKYEIKNNQRITGYLFIQLQPKLLIDENRFDDLLIEDVRLNNGKKHYDYSYAIYQDNKLLTQSGLYNYHLTNIWFKPNESNLLVADNGYNHLILNDTGKIIVVVSKKLNSVYYPFALFSLYFTLFTCLLLASLMMSYFINAYLFKRVGNSKLKKLLTKVLKYLFTTSEDILMLRSKIQIAVVSIVFVTLAFTALFTISLINNIYKERQTDKLIKKLRGVASTIDTEILTTEGRNNIETDAYLNRVGDYYATDITFFSTNGKVVGSTINKIYNSGVIAPVIDANAFFRLNSLKESHYINNENIARFSFTGAYMPLVNKNKIVTGYIMLPYFNRKLDLYNELSAILIGFINLYTLLFIVIGILAWLISRNISYPLALIQKHFAQVTLNKKNEPIKWQAEDEIGGLVEQYNKMIDELQRSATILAQSERESAWRDIARQIAHEIKNPLTPMKLSVQHLERAWNDKSSKLPETFKKVIQTLISQIDTLSELAGEFSNYAQMPVPKISKINLNALVASQAFAHQLDFNGKINIENNDEDVWVYFDESFLNRTFSNLIKNAKQAVPEDKEGFINISFHVKTLSVIVSVQDNGTGIPDDMLQSIFTPYFSTKSFGMGLGLPIVKNMIETGGGKIWFTTTFGVGTTFFVEIPFNIA